MSKGSRGGRELERLLAPDELRGDLVLDTVGLYCPIPIMRTAEKIKVLPAGQVIEVLSDDRVILIDMPAWCLSTGHTYLGYREDGGAQWRLFVRRR